MQRSPESARMTGNGTVFPQMLNLKPETSLYTLVGYHCHITVGITFTHDINVQKHFVEQQGKAFGPYSESITNELSWKKFWNKTLNSDWFFRRASKLQSAAAQISVRILLLKPSVLSGLSALSPAHAEARRYYPDGMYVVSNLGFPPLKESTVGQESSQDVFVPWNKYTGYSKKKKKSVIIHQTLSNN